MKKNNTMRNVFFIQKTGEKKKNVRFPSEINSYYK